MTPDQRRESIGLSHTSVSGIEDKSKAYSLEEFSYDYFRWAFPILHTHTRKASCLTLPSCCQASSQEHSEQGDDLEEPGEGSSVELHQGASQAASAEESAGSRGALPGGRAGLHRYPLIRLMSNNFSTRLNLPIPTLNQLLLLYVFNEYIINF